MDRKHKITRDKDLFAESCPHLTLFCVRSMNIFHTDIFHFYSAVGSHRWTPLKNICNAEANFSEIMMK